MLAIFSLYRFRRQLKVGDLVMVKLHKGVKQKMKIVITPSLGEVTLYNAHLMQYENYPLSKIYPLED